MDGAPPGIDRELLTASYSAATWRRFSSSLSSIASFAQHTGTQITWPIPETVIHKYINWAFYSQELSSATIKAYISDITTLHKFKNVDSSSCTSFFTKAALRGAENMELYKTISKKCKATMDLDLLKKLGSEIAKSSMSMHNKQVYWVACTLAFWGSFRMGELLEKTENEISAETLSWSDITLDSDSMTVHIKIPKKKSRTGDFIHIFEFSGHNACAVKAFRKLQQISHAPSHEHIFKLDNGKNLTQSKFTLMIKKWATPHRSRDFVMRLSGHSFRNAIPSILASSPELAEDDDICIWGRWDSTAFQLYARTSSQTKRRIFSKICNAIDSSCHRSAH